MISLKKLFLSSLLLLASNISSVQAMEENKLISNQFKNIPEELIVAIFEHLDCKYLGISMQVNKEFRRFAIDALKNRIKIFSFPISKKNYQEIRRKIVNAKNISENKNLPKQQMAKLNTQLNKYSQPTALPTPIQVERVLELIRAGADKKIGTQLAFSAEDFLQIFGTILMNIEDQQTRNAIQSGRNHIQKSRRKTRKSKKSLEKSFKKLSL